MVIYFHRKCKDLRVNKKNTYDRIQNAFEI